MPFVSRKLPGDIYAPPLLFYMPTPRSETNESKTQYDGQE